MKRYTIKYHEFGNRRDSIVDGVLALPVANRLDPRQPSHLAPKPPLGINPECIARYISAYPE